MNRAAAAQHPATAKYIALTTFRRDGRAVTTPVWPVALEGRLYVGTHTGTGKVKRLRREPRVRFAPCDARGRRILGDWHEGTARLVDDPALAARAEALLQRKYGLVYRLVMLIYRLRGWYAQRVLLEITW